MIRYKKIIVLGSGFSKSVSRNMPTLSQLTERLHHEKDSVSYPDLIPWIKKLMQKSGGLEELTRIETVASIIFDRVLFFSEKQRIQNSQLQHQLFLWIYRTLNTLSPGVDAEIAGTVQKFLRKISYVPGQNMERETLIMTFNYDLLLERLAGATDDISIDYLIRLNSYGVACRPDELQARLDVLKLHGSFNWFHTPGLKGDHLEGTYLVDEQDLERHLIHHEDVPVYLPMTHSKSRFLTGSLYQVLWTIANRVLSEADEIHFIGYGFPPSDVSNLEWFLNFRERIKSIVVMEKKKSQLKRLHQLFPNSRIINEDAVNWIDLWMQSSPQGKALGPIPEPQTELPFSVD